jgi:hypothetical protein
LALGLLAAIGYFLNRALCMPAARNLPVSARLAEARRIAAEDSIGRLPCEQPLARAGRSARQHRSPGFVAHCDDGPALGVRHAPRP